MYGKNYALRYIEMPKRRTISNGVSIDNGFANADA